MDPGPGKFVHLMFAAGGLLAAWVMALTIDWVAGYFVRPNPLAIQAAAVLVGGGAAFVAWRNPNVHALAGEVVIELRKVTWPTFTETKWATIIVIITCAIASIILGLFDTMWSWATGKLYG